MRPGPAAEFETTRLFTGSLDQVLADLRAFVQEGAAHQAQDERAARWVRRSVFILFGSLVTLPISFDLELPVAAIFGVVGVSFVHLVARIVVAVKYTTNVHHEPRREKTLRYILESIADELCPEHAVLVRFDQMATTREAPRREWGQLQVRLKCGLRLRVRIRVKHRTKYSRPNGPRSGRMWNTRIKETVKISLRGDHLGLSLVGRQPSKGMAGPTLSLVNIENTQRGTQITFATQERTHVTHGLYELVVGEDIPAPEETLHAIIRACRLVRAEQRSALQPGPSSAVTVIPPSVAQENA